MTKNSNFTNFSNLFEGSHFFQFIYGIKASKIITKLQEQAVQITGNVTIEGQDTYTLKVAGIYIVNLQVECQGKTYDVEMNVEFIRTIRILADDVEVGDYVNYDANSGLIDPVTYKTDKSLTGSSTSTTFSSKDRMKWRVLSVDREKGKIELISSDTTPNTLSLSGRTGYINAEDVLNDIGSVYGNGKGAIGGRSINLDDVEQYSSYDPYTYIYGDYSYGGTKKYTSGNYFVDIGDGAIKGGIENTDEDYTECQKATSANPITAKCTHYEYSAQNYFENETVYKMLFRNEVSSKSSFWLASRCVYLGNFSC